jgi:hypothetical protein
VWRGMAVAHYYELHLSAKSTSLLMKSSALLWGKALLLLLVSQTIGMQ